MILARPDREAEVDDHPDRADHPDHADRWLGRGGQVGQGRRNLLIYGRFRDWT